VGVLAAVLSRVPPAGRRYEGHESRVLAAHEQALGCQSRWRHQGAVFGSALLSKRECIDELLSEWVSDASEDKETNERSQKMVDQKPSQVFPRKIVTSATSAIK